MTSILTRTLSSGCTVIVEPMRGVRSAAISCLLPAGSAFDPPHALGTSAVIAEMLVRGAGDLDSRALAEAFDRIGASKGTDAGHVSFRVSSTMLGERAPDALRLLASMILRPRFDPDALGPSRDLALQELASVADDLPTRASLLLRANHLPAPHDRSGLGTVEGLNAVTIEGLRSHWRTSAAPTPSVIALAGDVRPDDAVRHAEDLFSNWSGSNPDPVPGPAPGRGHVHERVASNQVQVLIAHDAPPEPHDDSLLERFVIAVLSGGMSGRLFSEVREKRGLCYSVSASYRAEKDLGVVSAYVGTTPERAQEALDVLWDQLRHILTPAGAVTPEEFERAKVGMKTSVVFGGESTGARAASLASDFRKRGRPRSLDEIAAAVDAITLDQVNEYLSRRVLGRPTVVTLGPQELSAARVLD